MGYVEDTLLPGETVVYRTRLHWTVLIGNVIGGAAFIGLAIVVGIFAIGAQPGAKSGLLIATVVLVAIAAVIFIAGAVKRRSTEMAVTNRRVLIKRGIVQRHTLELFITKIESVVVSETFLGRMLGYGTVVVRGTGGTPEVFERVAHPIEFRRQIQGQIEAPVSPSGAPPGAPSPPSSFMPPPARPN